ncbi:hypothetical protein pb186bvf_002897 [Paramecium bursaria]
MSAKNYRLIHSQKKNEVRFRDDPLRVSDNFQVYLAVEPNRVFELIEQDRAKPKYGFLDRLTTRSGLVSDHQNTQPQERKIETVPSEQIPRIETQQKLRANQKSVQIQAKLPQRRLTLQQFKDSLQFDERTKSLPKTTLQNNIVDSIIQNSDVLLKRQDLVQSMQSLKRLSLLRDYKFNHNSLPGVGKSPYVYNDFHSKSTNNGFSRNAQNGNFFTR